MAWLALGGTNGLLPTRVMLKGKAGVQHDDDARQRSTSGEFDSFVSRRRGKASLKAVAQQEQPESLLPALKQRVAEEMQNGGSPDEPMLYNLGTLLLQQVVDQSPEEAAALQAEALAYFEMAAALNPNRDASQFNIAMLREASGDADGALDAYKEAIRVTNDEQTAIACYNNKVGLLLARERLDEAAQVADAAVNAYPQDPSTWTSLGVVLRINGNSDWASTCFENALARGPDEKNLVALNNLGALLAKAGRRHEAVSMLNRALKVKPDDLSSLKAIAPILVEVGSSAEAADCLRRAIALDPFDNSLSFQLSVVENTWPLATGGKSNQPPPGVPLVAGSGGGGPLASSEAAPLTVPREFVADLFDYYAQSGYDRHMVETLGYKVPELMWSTFLARCKEEPRLLSKGALAAFKTIEVGVGSGLCGAFFRSRGLGGDIVGCDLSPIMIQQASRSEFVSDGAHELVYRSVVVSDAVEFVSACGRSETDLVLAADVVCYMGDLRALLQKVRFALKIGGTLLFSVEELEGPSAEVFSLQPSGRFAHSEHYIVDLAGRCGYEVASVQRGVLRADGGVPVNGASFALVAVDLSGACELGSE